MADVPDETGRDRVADLLNAYADDKVTSLETMKRVERLCAHLDAQATAIATLEAENERLREVIETIDRLAYSPPCLSGLLGEECDGGCFACRLHTINRVAAAALDTHPTQTEDETDA